MKGGIYSTEKCPVCGSSFQDTGTCLACPNHKKINSTKLAIKFGDIYKRFRDYDDARRFLTGLRFKTDEKTFDARDYKKDNPLGFTNMSNKFLQAIKPKTAKNIKFHIDHAQSFFDNRNIKDLRCGDFEDFLLTLTLADKTKNNIISTIRNFYKWMKKRQDILAMEMPEFPEVSYQLGYRHTVDKATQQTVIEEVKRICPNIKVYLGIKWLATYFSIRPQEMIKLPEGEIDLANAYLHFPHPKERTFKSVPILPEDIEIIRKCGLTFPAMRFFRHIKGIKGCIENQPFGLKYFYKWWIKACNNLGVVGVDLYGGTCHSTVRALRSFYTPEEIKEAAMRRTNKAFERYMGQANDADILSVYRQSSVLTVPQKPDTVLIPDLGGAKNAK